MPEDFGVLARTALKALLAPGEPLVGVCAAIHQKAFSGQMYAVGVTDLRLLLQPVGRHAEAKGEPILVVHQNVEAVQLDGAADGWWTAPMAILSANSLTLKLRLRDGRTLKLMMMRGGAGLMGAMGGGTHGESGAARCRPKPGGTLRIVRTEGHDLDAKRLHHVAQFGDFQATLEGLLADLVPVRARDARAVERELNEIRARLALEIRQQG